jgi:hypothetical protein
MGASRFCLLPAIGVLVIAGACAQPTPSVGKEPAQVLELSVWESPGRKIRIELKNISGEDLRITPPYQRSYGTNLGIRIEAADGEVLSRSDRSEYANTYYRVSSLIDLEEELGRSIVLAPGETWSSEEDPNFLVDLIASQLSAPVALSTRYVVDFQTRAIRFDRGEPEFIPLESTTQCDWRFETWGAVVDCAEI